MISTKWPGLIVVGKDISVELALEINIRTTRFPLSTNNSQYNIEVMSYILQRPYNDCNTGYELQLEVSKILKSLDVYYFRNDWLASNYIGGPHGWCNPSGKLFSNNYNIGKWPGNEEVEAELELIAKTWPELEFTVQLLSDEFCCDSSKLFVTDQYEISNGFVTSVNPSIRKDSDCVQWSSNWRDDEIFLSLNDVKQTIDRLRNQ